MGRSRFKAGDGTIDRARALRRQSTPAEQRIWRVVRNRTLDGHKFRRQQRLGPFYADFVCQELRLVVEIDGDTHGDPAAMRRDATRSAYMMREGYRIVRFNNAEVMRNLEGVVAALRLALIPSPSHPAVPGGPLPLPPRGEER